MNTTPGEPESPDDEVTALGPHTEPTTFSTFMPTAPSTAPESSALHPTSRLGRTFSVHGHSPTPTARPTRC